MGLEEGQYLECKYINKPLKKGTCACRKLINTSQEERVFIVVIEILLYYILEIYPFLYHHNGTLID